MDAPRSTYKTFHVEWVIYVQKMYIFSQKYTTWYILGGEISQNCKKKKSRSETGSQVKLAKTHCANFQNMHRIHFITNFWRFSILDIQPWHPWNFSRKYTISPGMLLQLQKFSCTHFYFLCVDQHKKAVFHAILHRIQKMVWPKLLTSSNISLHTLWKKKTETNCFL